jgi:dihydrofolate reductase
MSKLVVTSNLTLDGVVQSPAAPDEDTRGGFARGGWAPPYVDEVMAGEMSKGIAQGGSLLFGRRTYEHFESFWPTQPDDNPFAKVLNERQKYIASTTLRSPEWRNSTVLEGDTAEAVARLKAQPGGDIVILGSAELVRSLMPHGLIDEYVISIHPLVLGAGLRLFEDGSAFTKLRLVDATPTTTGVLIARYEPVLR